MSASNTAIWRRHPRMRKGTLLCYAALFSRGIEVLLPPPPIQGGARPSPSKNVLFESPFYLSLSFSLFDFNVDVIQTRPVKSIITETSRSRPLPRRDRTFSQPPHKRATCQWPPPFHEFHHSFANVFQFWIVQDRRESPHHNRCCHCG